MDDNTTPRINLKVAAETNSLVFYDEATEFTKEDLATLREVHRRRAEAQEAQRTIRQWRAQQDPFYDERYPEDAILKYDDVTSEGAGVVEEDFE